VCNGLEWGGGEGVVRYMLVWEREEGLGKSRKKWEGVDQSRRINVNYVLCVFNIIFYL